MRLGREELGGDQSERQWPESQVNQVGLTPRWELPQVDLLLHWLADGHLLPVSFQGGPSVHVHVCGLISSYKDVSQMGLDALQTSL